MNDRIKELIDRATGFTMSVYEVDGTRTWGERTEVFDKEKFAELIKQYLMDNLRLDTRTDSVYNGGFASGGQMYDQRHSVQLILDGEVISEVTL